MSRIPLLPPTFEIGEPSNSLSDEQPCWSMVPPCRDPNFDYVAAKWAKDWHGTVGARDTASLLRSAHQNRSGTVLNDNASRIEIQERIGSDGTPTNVARLIHGVSDMSGGVGLGKYLNPAFDLSTENGVAWKPGARLKMTSEFMATSEDMDAELYANIELRCTLDFVPKNEQRLAVSVATDRTGFVVKWWGAREERAPIGDREEAVCSYGIKRDTWYRVAVFMDALDAENCWDLGIRIKTFVADENAPNGIRDEVIWQYSDKERPVVGVANVWLISLGNEHSLKRNRDGGIWIWNAPHVWDLNGEIDEEENQ